MVTFSRFLELTPQPEYEKKSEKMFEGVQELTCATFGTTQEFDTGAKVVLYPFTVQFFGQKRCTFYAIKKEERDLWLYRLSQALNYTSHLSNYAIKESLGKGTFAEVRLAGHLPSKRPVALKIVKRDSISSFQEHCLFTQESYSLQLASGHPNVIQYVESFVTNEYLCLATECAAGSELSALLENGHEFSEAEVKRIMADLLSGLKHLHSAGVVHRDLKPENIFVNDSKSLLIDFNLSTMVSGATKKCTGFAGSLPYVAPEILLGFTYDAAVDMWSLGVVAHLLLLGCMPYSVGKSADQQKMYALRRELKKLNRIVMNWDGRVKGTTISETAKDFAQSKHSFLFIASIRIELLVRNPAKRMTAEEALRHPWICA